MIKAKFFSHDTCIMVFGLVQWDVGQVLEISGLDLKEGAEVHFSNPTMKNAIRKPILEGCKVEIPDELLEQSHDITAWIYEDNETIKEIFLFVEKRKKPDGFVTDQNAKSQLEDFGKDLMVTSGKIGGGVASSIPELNKKIDDVNALGLKNLEEKGVAIEGTEDVSTHFIMESIADIPLNENAEKEFWDTYQQNGSRTDYDWAFGGSGWSDETFKPKYNMIATNSQRIFSKSAITNLKKIFDDASIVLDFSQCATINYPFSQSTITDIGILNVAKATNLNYFLHQCRNLKNVEKVILNENGKQSFNETFSFGECESLEHIIFEGAIANEINLSWSPLDWESVLSIVNALVDYSEIAPYEKTVIFSDVTMNDIIDNHNEFFDMMDAKAWLY